MPRSFGANFKYLQARIEDTLAVLLEGHNKDRKYKTKTWVSVGELKALQTHLDHELILLIERISKHKPPPKLPPAYAAMLSKLPVSDEEVEEKLPAPHGRVDRSHISLLPSEYALVGREVRVWLHDIFNNSLFKWSGVIAAVVSTPAAPFANSANKPSHRVVCDVVWSKDDIKMNAVGLTKGSVGVELVSFAQVQVLGDVCALPRFDTMNPLPDPSPPPPSGFTDFDSLYGFKVTLNMFDMCWTGSVARSQPPRVLADGSLEAGLAVSVEWQGEGLLMDFSSGSTVQLQTLKLAFAKTDITNRAKLVQEQQLEAYVAKTKTERVRPARPGALLRHRRQEQVRCAVAGSC